VPTLKTKITNLLGQKFSQLEISWILIKLYIFGQAVISR